MNMRRYGDYGVIRSGEKPPAPIFGCDVSYRDVAAGIASVPPSCILRAAFPFPFMHSDFSLFRERLAHAAA